MAKARKSDPQSKHAHRTESTESVMTPNPTATDSNISNRINDSLDKPISDVHKDYDTDLARDNLENNNTAADLQDL